MRRAIDGDEKIRVLLVGGHRLLTEAVAWNLVAQPRFRVLGMRPPGASLMAEVDPPDVVLVFGRASEGRLTDLVRSARRAWPRATLLVAPDADRLEAVLPLLQAGADGYVLRSASVDDLFDLIDRAYRRDTLLSAVAIRAMSRRVDATRMRPSETARVERLTPREMTILRSLREGLPPRAIAERDATSRATVRTHIQNILRKLGAHSILEAVAYSVRHGIVDAPSTESSADDDGS